MLRTSDDGVLDAEAARMALVARGKLPPDSIERYASGSQHYMQRVAASQMRKFFEGREMPAECAAFIDDCSGR